MFTTTHSKTDASPTFKEIYQIKRSMSLHLFHKTLYISHNNNTKIHVETICVCTQTLSDSKNKC